MKCKNCGAELEYIGTITTEESHMASEGSVSMVNSHKALEVIHNIEFKEGELMSYVDNAYEGLIYGMFIRKQFVKRINTKYNTEYKDIEVEGVKLYGHP